MHPSVRLRLCLSLSLPPAIPVNDLRLCSLFGIPGLVAGNLGLTYTKKSPGAHISEREGEGGREGGRRAEGQGGKGAEEQMRDERHEKVDESHERKVGEQGERIIA